MLDDPHLLASGALESVQLGDGKATRLPTLPIAFDGELVAREASLSQIDQDRETILRDYLGS